MDSMKFADHFPCMCCKYGCFDEIPTIRELYEGRENIRTMVNIPEFYEQLRRKTAETIPRLSYRRTIEMNMINVVNPETTTDSDTAIQTHRLSNLPKHTEHKYLPRLPKKKDASIALKNLKKYEQCHQFLYLIYGKENATPVLVRIMFQNVCLSVLIFHALVDSVEFLKHLTRLDFVRCQSTPHVLGSIIKLVCLTQLTELTLDNCLIPDLNHINILSDTSNLKMLSLSKCGIKDKGVQLISSQLAYHRYPAHTLEILILSSNVITDKGARRIGNFLRTNRRLKTLVLADNKIEEAGCCAIADSCKSFCLTIAEVNIKKMRNFFFLVKNDKLFCEYINSKIKQGGKSGSENQKADEDEDSQSEEECVNHESLNMDNSFLADMALVDELIEKTLGDLSYPFRRTELFYSDKNMFCKGNNMLEVVNLAFNNISSVGINRFVEVIQYQTKTNRKSLQSIAFEGNPYVFTNSEYHQLSMIIQ